MGKLIPTGMRTRIVDPSALFIGTCSGNDAPFAGDHKHWSWANPTNTRFPFEFHGLPVVSTEALWQGCKIIEDATEPDPEVLAGAWRKNKGRKPRGSWCGHGVELITDPGEARRLIYIPAYVRQLRSWLKFTIVRAMIHRALDHDGPVYLRDFDTGQGIDRKGPMSHAWLLSQILEPLLQDNDELVDYIVYRKEG